MIQYSSTIDKFITFNEVFTWDEMEYFDRLEKQWKQSLPNYSFNELIKIFPEATKVAQKCLEEEIIQYRKDLILAEEWQKEFDTLLYRKCSKDSEVFWQGVCDVFYIQPLIKGKEDAIKRNSFYLLSLNKKNIIPKSGVSDADIERAKSFPIANMISFNKHGVARCIFHTEKTGSLHYYRKTNKVHCFGCDKSADAIDVYRHIHGVDFISAVKALI